MDLRQSASYAKYIESIGWKSVRYKKNYYFIKNFFFGSFIKLQRPVEFSSSDIDFIAKKYHAIAVCVEPVTLSEAHIEGFTVRSPFVPSKTVVIDVTLSKEQLLSNCRKHTKQAIKKSSQVQIHSVSNISAFRNAWMSATRGSRYVPSTKKLKDFIKSFKEDVVIFMDKDGHAGALFVASNDTAYYWHGFTDQVGRQKEIQYQILWRGLLWAKSHNKKLFDMEGIYDTRFPIKGWEGFSHFKKGFGGTEVEYPGARIQYFGIWKYLKVF